MKRIIQRIAIAVMMTATLWTAPQAIAAVDPITELLQKGLMEEETQRDLGAAIQTYEEVLKRIDSQRRIAATAVFRLGESYRKLQRTNDAVKLFLRLLREFPEENALADLSRQNLLSLGSKSATPGESAAVEMDDESRELARLRNLITTSPDLLDAANNSLFGGLTPLQQAADKGWPRVTDFLLGAGATRDGIGNQTLAPLHYAALMGHKAVAERLLQAGASPNLANNSGFTPLHFAIGRGHKQMSQWLLEKGADPNLMTLASAKIPLFFDSAPGMTPLGIALQNRWAPGVDLLIQAKASVMAGAPGQSPLEVAARKLLAGDIEKLVAAGADPKAPYPESLFKIALTRGIGSPELTECLRTLKKVGAPLDDSVANYFLQSAVTAGLWRAVDVLLELGANPNVIPAGNNVSDLMIAVTFCDRREDTAEMRASGAREKVVKSLLTAGADPNLVPSGKTPPLISAVRQQNLLLVTSLLKAGANPNSVDETLTTPLQVAIGNRSIPFMDILLDAGADPNQLSQGSTPLRIALGALDEKGSTEGLDLLIRHKADLNLRSGYNRLTPLEFARDLINQGKQNDPSRWHPSDKQVEGLRAIVALLLQHGAKEEVPDFSSIQARRGGTTRTTIYSRPSTNDWNRFTLHEALATLYGRTSRPAPAMRLKRSGSSFGSVMVSGQPEGDYSFPWPALEAITISRYNAAGEKTVLQTGTTNQLLQWGDVIEIPETAHALDASWGGLSPEQMDEITRSLHGSIQFSVSGVTTNLSYTPKTFPRNFGLEDMLMESKLLKNTSDLTRVQVIRPAHQGTEPQTWTFNLREPGDWPDLWLRDGDSVVVDALPSARVR